MASVVVGILKGSKMEESKFAPFLGTVTVIMVKSGDSLVSFSKIISSIDRVASLFVDSGVVVIEITLRDSADDLNVSVDAKVEGFNFVATVLGSFVDEVDAVVDAVVVVEVFVVVVVAVLVVVVVEVIVVVEVVVNEVVVVVAVVVVFVVAVGSEDVTINVVVVDKAGKIVVEADLAVVVDTDVSGVVVGLVVVVDVVEEVVIGFVEVGNALETVGVVGMVLLDSV